MKPGKIAEGSLLTTDDQLRLYREMMSPESVERQLRESRKRRGLCICPGGGRKVKWDWNLTGKKTQRVIHEEWCPRRKPWMSEAEAIVAKARDHRSTDAPVLSVVEPDHET